MITGTYALAKRRGQVIAGIYAASAALNCGIAGATFFSVRGYVIVPLLDQAVPSRLRERERESPRRAPEVLPEASRSDGVTWGAMRLNRVLDSALSGGITGSVLNTWRRGTRGTFTGMMFGSVFCTLGQVLYNEMGVQRLKFISRRYPIPSQPPTPSTVSGPAEPSVPKKPLLDRMIHVIGINRLSDEEYLVQMREKRAAYLRRIENLETQLEEDDSSKHS